MTTQQTGMDVSQIAQVSSQAGYVMEGVRQTRILALFDHLDTTRIRHLIQPHVCHSEEMD